jgi:hypothetical protein
MKRALIASRHGGTLSSGIYKIWVIDFYEETYTEMRTDFCHLCAAGRFILHACRVGFRQGTGSTIMVSPRTVIGEMFAGSVVEQSFLSSYDALDGITLFGATYSRNNDDTLEIAVYDENNVCLSSAELNTYDLPDNAEWHIDFERPATGVKGKRLTLAVTSLRGARIMPLPCIAAIPVIRADLNWRSTGPRLRDTTVWLWTASYAYRSRVRITIGWRNITGLLPPH